MTIAQKLNNLSVPQRKIDVILDTDAYNEIDDQYAIAYLLRSGDKLNTKAIYAAPFHNQKVSGPAEGMDLSYQEIHKILKLTDCEVAVYRGSEAFLTDEKTPVISEAAQDLARCANDYSPENPLYVVAIGAITNIASAILLNPKVCENTVVIWLGGHAQHYHNNFEFNMRQDVAAARVVFGSGVPLVQLPCRGVVSEFTLSKPEIESWILGKSALGDYLGNNTIQYLTKLRESSIWSKPIWDVTAVAWLLNENDRFMLSRIIATPMPTYDLLYAQNANGEPMRYVYHIQKEALLIDLIEKITR